MSCCSDSNDPDVLTISVGEDFQHTFKVLDANGQPVNLTGYQLFFIVKNRLEDKNWIIRKRSLNAGGSDTQAIILDQTTLPGQYKVFIDAVDTLTKCPSLEAPYVYGTWVVSPANKTTRVVRMGDFNLQPAVMQF